MNNKQLIESFAQKVWNEKNLDFIDDIFDPKCVIHSLLGDFHGPAEMKKVADSWLKAFPDMKVHNRAFIGDNDLVVIHWDVKGTHKGEFKGIKPTGKPVNYAGATIYRVKNGKVVEYWAYIDMQHLLNQIS